VTAGDNRLRVTPSSDGALADGLKVYVKTADGSEVTITTAAVPQDFTEVEEGKVNIAGGVITVTLDAADANGGPTKLKSGGTVTVTLAADAQISQVGSIEAQSYNSADTAPPDKVTGLAATNGNTESVLTWTDPDDEDFDHVVITWTPGGTTPVSVAKEEETYTANGTLYTFTVKAVDAAGNKSTGVTATATPEASTPDTTPPAEVTDLSATNGDTESVLTWTDPTDEDFHHVVITWTPGGTDPVSVTKRAETYTATSLINDTTYTFTVKTVDATGNKSTGVTATATPTAEESEPEIPAAAITNGVIIKTVGNALDETVTVTLSGGATFKADLGDRSGWITGWSGGTNPDWLTIGITWTGNTALEIALTGQAEALATTPLTLTIPVAALDGADEDIVATGNFSLTVKTAAENVADELANSLGEGVTASGTTVTVTGATATVSGSAPVVVPAGVTLSVAANGKLTVAGTLNVETGAVVNVGNGAEIEVSGSYSLGNEVTGTNDGTVTVTATGTITNETDVDIGGSGTNVVEAGGTVYFSSSVLFVGSDEEADAVFQLGEGATFSFDNSGFELDGEVTLNTGNSGSTFELNAGAQALTLTAGSTLTVKGGKTLSVTRTGERSGPGVVGDTGARIIVTGTLDVSGDSAHSNFYDGDGAKITASQTDAAFTWNASAGGEGNAGWVVDTSPRTPGSVVVTVVTVEDGYDAILDIDVSTGIATVTPDENGIVTFTPVSGYTGIKWYLFNGVGTTEAVSNTYPFNTASIENRPYTLTVTAEKGRHLFSQTVTFTVGEPAE
jgi:hypothetical protein